MKNLIPIFLLIVVLGCNKEQLDPYDFRNNEEISKNYITLNEGSFIVDDEFLEQIDSIGPDFIHFSNPLNVSYSTGDVLISNAGQNVNSGFLFKVIEVKGQEIMVEEATLIEAYSAYHIDTRSNEVEVRPRNGPITRSLNFKRKIFGAEFGFTGFFTPEIKDGTFSIDTALSYFTADYDPAQGNAPKFTLSIKSFKYTCSYQFEAGFKIEGKAKKEYANIIPPIPVPGTPLAVHFVPKIELSGGVKGTFTSPTYNFVFGEYDFLLEYDENLQGAEKLKTTFNHNNMPNNEEGGWSASGKGGITVKAGVEVAIGVPKTIKFAKASAFGYVYGSVGAKGVSTFANPHPGVALTCEIGFACAFSAELNFFGGSTPQNLPLWFPTGSKIESAEFKYPYKQWQPYTIHTCDPFLPTTSINKTTILVGNDKSDRIQYNIYINDELYRPVDFLYNFNINLSYPPTNELVDKIEIIDIYNPGCFIEDYIVNPEIFGACTSSFIDVRDGNEYCQVQIGNQVWMGENLRYSDFEKIGKWYDNEISGDNQLYGRLYTFDELLNGEEANKFSTSKSSYRKIRGICPAGWRIPSDKDYFELNSTLSNDEWKHPSKILWPNSNSTENQFNVIPSGAYYPWSHSAKFQFKNERAYLWSNTLRNISSDINLESAFIVEITDTDGYIGPSAANGGVIGTAGPNGSGYLGTYTRHSIKNVGYSCRCIKDL